MGRLTEDVGIIPMYEAKDWAAGADSETVELSKGATLDIILNTGVLTVPGALSLFSGATAGAKTTALPFTYRITGADYLAAAADQFGADVAESDGVLTLSATAHDRRTIVISVSAAEVAANGSDHKWVTMALAAGTAQVVAAIGIVRGVRYQPPVTAVPTS